MTQTFFSIIPLIGSANKPLMEASAAFAIGAEAWSEGNPAIVKVGNGFFCNNPQIDTFRHLESMRAYYMLAGMSFHTQTFTYLQEN